MNRVSTSCSVKGSENNARFEDDDFGTVYVTGPKSTKQEKEWTSV